MNWDHLLSSIRPELLKEVMIEFGLPPTADKGLMKKTIISFLGRNSVDEEKRLVEFLRKQVMTYELSTIIQMNGLDRPADRSQYFDYIINNLDFVDREDEEEEVLRQEDVTETKLDDIVTEEEAGPEYTAEDERDWGIEASKLVGLFRKIKYSLGEAVADVVDNSIDVGATEVNVSYEMDRDNGCRYLIIADNGTGMDDKTMQSSMYLGLDRDREDSELGKFGVGLKISSLSQAEEIIVISDHKDSDETVIRRISYPYIKENNSLKLLTKAGRDIIHFDEARESLGYWKTGTVVLWEKMDPHPIPYARLKKYRDEFEKQKIHLRDSLAVRFHRYISGDTKSGKKIVINLQNNPIQPIDPLGMDLTDDDMGYGTLSDTVTKRYVDSQENAHQIPVTMVIQPHRERIEPSTFHRMKDAVGSDINAQGIYLYRNHRLIKWGGWMGVGGKVPHNSLNLCRVGIDVPISLDEEFGLEPTKTDYDMPEHFKDDLNLLFNSASRKFSDGAIQYTFLKRGLTRARHESKVRKHRDKPQKKPKSTAATSPELTSSDPELLSAKTVKTGAKSGQRKKVSVVIVPSAITSELMWIETKTNETKIYLNKGHALYDKARQALRDID